MYIVLHRVCGAHLSTRSATVIFHQRFANLQILLLLLLLLLREHAFRGEKNSFLFIPYN